jgi:hypothetical protein
LLVPNFFGEPGSIGYWGDGGYEEFIFYVGVLPLFLVLALGFRRASRHHLTTYLLALGGIGLLLALGQFGVLHRLAYNYLPLFSSARVPARAGFLFAFALAALAGLSLTGLRQEPEEAKASLRSWVRGPSPWLVVAFSVLVVLAGFMAFALQRDSNPEAGRLWHVANNVALFLLYFLLTVALLLVWQRGLVTTRQSAVLAFALVLLDLWGYGRTMIQPATLEESAYWRIVSEITAGGEGRVLPWDLSVFEQNKGMARGLENVFGYDPLELEWYSRFITAVPDPRARAYDLLGARYLVTTYDVDFSAKQGAPQLLEQRDGVRVYERPTVLPRVWLVHQVEDHPEKALLDRLNDPAFDPQRVALLTGASSCELAEPTRSEDVRIIHRGHNQVEIEVDADADGLLVLSEIFYPGWRVTIDGQPASILQTNYVLRGVCVLAGRHRVVFSFAPSSLRIGAAVSFLSLLLVAVAGVKLWRDRSP